MADVAARDARRRRLVDRGSDRLAFITGLSRSIPPSTEQAPQSPSASLLEDVTGLSLRQHHESKGPTASSAENASGIEPVITSKTIHETPRHESGHESMTRAVSNEATMTNFEADGPCVKASTASALQTSIEPAIQSQTAPHINPHRTQSIFTARKISHSISLSENLRLICAVAIGLLVMLQYHAYSFGGNLVRSIITFRPLLLVLLTDATIVLGRVLLAKESNGGDNERTKVEADSTNSISQALEVALVLQKGLTAVTMDCSICAAIIICAFVFKGSI
ncbi:hypothetical protein IHE45_20G090700 [Dioscorea alata]|uniref:Uncharacterized protein n=1 Tax=Dioscorea alata TaxID=55571 RepID=A0ACB7TW26_DIOAL|nr:hypothetical protein IHE45_20G090700 [Dioscorea alata]